MKPAPLLSHLVAYKNRLDELALTDMIDRWSHELAKTFYVAVNDPVVRFKKNNARVEHALQSLNDSLTEYQGSVDQLKQSVDDLIKTQQQEYLARSYHLWDVEMRGETVQYILQRRLNIQDDDRELLTAKILNYNDWRVPGMVLRPGLESWIDHLVALDPLYVVDQHQELLIPSLDRFPAEYQRRMRPYVIDDRTTAEIFYQLPKSQFGYIFAYNFFNFRPFEILNRYLQELFELLRPGGTLFLTFNNCDRAHNVALVESSFMCYTPGAWVRESAQQIGYEVVDFYHGSADCAWIELRRPGKQRSMKGAQTLAKIFHRSK